jgi:hypothetical protein
MKNLSEHDQRIMMTLRAKNRFLTMKAMTQYQNKMKAQQKKTKIDIKEEDLVLIKNKTRNN